MKKDADEELLDAAEAHGVAALQSLDDVGDFEVFGNTRIHLIFKGRSKAGRALCLKVNLRAIKALTEGVQKPVDRTEIRAFERIGNQVDWAPKLVAASDDGSWFLREWVGDFTTDRIKKADWKRQKLDDLWHLFADAFAVLHAEPEPFLMRDIKPTNVSFDSDRFYLFDFNTTKSLSSIQGINHRSRLGSGSNRYTAPELLGSCLSGVSCRTDYFGFASVFHRFAIGRSSAVWTNTGADENATIMAYDMEFAALKDKYALILAEHGYAPRDIAFLVACLNPRMDQRPDQFQRPN